MIWLREMFGLSSVRKKVLLLSKLAGLIIVIIYVITNELPVDKSCSFWIWLILLASVIMGVDFLLAVSISKPLAALNERAARMADLDFSVKCTITSNDELGHLSNSLNIMSANLQNALINLETANKELGKDIERERLLLSRHKELSDTLSHEMKTPLGIIRAYTEGLKEETDALKRQKFMDIILSETERMNHMIVSLLDLSALETGAVKLSKERFDFIEFSETVAGRLLIDAPGVNFKLHYDLPETQVFVFADKQRLEQVLSNLIINAKKHVLPTGIIRLSVVRKENTLYFSIYNQGALIPEQALDRIWTKFYRGEDMVSRNGSGLGLSIVAQILTMHKVAFGFHNLSDGVEFYFTIPTVN